MSLCACISMDRALQRRTQRQPTPRGRRPPLGPLYPRGGGGGVFYGRRKNESGPTGLWMDSPERATGVGVGPMRWIVHVWKGVIRLEGWGGGAYSAVGGHPPTASRSRLQDSCSQMTEQGVVGAGLGTPSALQLGSRPKPAAGRRPAECRWWCSRSQRASPRAAALHPAGAGCRMAARRVQKMV